MLTDLPCKTTSTSVRNERTPARNKVEKWEQIGRLDIHHRRHLVTEHPQGSVHLPLRTEATIMRPCHHRRKARIYLMVEVQRLILQQRRQWDSGVDLNNLAVGAIPGAGVCAADNRLFVFITDVLSAPNNGTNNWEEHKSLRKQRWFTVESVFFFIQMHRSERPADIESRPCAFSVNMLVSDERTVWNETLGYLTLWICHHWKFLKCCFGKKKLAQSLPN